MEMKGIIEHSILGDDAEILLREQGKYGGCARWRRVKLSDGASGATGRRTVSDLTRRRGRRERREIKRRNTLRLLSGTKGTEK